jgi:hypothetical protein
MTIWNACVRFSNRKRAQHPQFAKIYPPSWRSLFRRIPA